MCRSKNWSWLIKQSVLLHDDDDDDDDEDDDVDDDDVDDQYHGIKGYTFARWNNYFKLLLTILSRNTFMIMMIRNLKTIYNDASIESST